MGDPQPMSLWQTVSYIFKVLVTGIPLCLWVAVSTPVMIVWELFFPKDKP
jgi:hypothetical protein